MSSYDRFEERHLSRSITLDDTVLFLPEKNLGSLSGHLRNLTKLIHESKLADASGYGLGGEFGYGVDFENDVFMLHRFCWCEKDHCLWCMGCDCPEGARIPHYFIDNREVTFRQWLDFFNINVPTVDNPDWRTISDQINRRRSTSVDEHEELLCDFCTGRHEVYKLSGQKQVVAPNFWHKESGFRVWWYKWIGRDNKVFNPNHIGLDMIFTESSNSLRMVN